MPCTPHDAHIQNYGREVRRKVFKIKSSTYQEPFCVTNVSADAFVCVRCLKVGSNPHKPLCAHMQFVNVCAYVCAYVLCTCVRACVHECLCLRVSGCVLCVVRMKTYVFLVVANGINIGEALDKRIWFPHSLHVERVTLFRLPIVWPAVARTLSDQSLVYNYYNPPFIRGRRYRHSRERTSICYTPIVYGRVRVRLSVSVSVLMCVCVLVCVCACVGACASVRVACVCVGDNVRVCPHDCVWLPSRLLSIHHIHISISASACMVSVST